MSKESKQNTKMNISMNTTNKTMDYMNSITKSIINNTQIEPDADSNIESEAKILMKKGRSLCLKRCCLVDFCSNKEKRYEKAIDFYNKAGDKYKSIHHWRNAGICYENCGLIQQKILKDPLNFYEEAYFCYEKIDIGDDLMQVFKKINSLLEKDGKFFQIGKNYENLGIKRENKEKYDIAIEHYLQAVEYYEKDGQHENLKTKIFIKLSELMILHNHPKSRIKVPSMLESIGKNYLSNIMTKYLAKEYFGKAILTRLYFNDDIQEAKNYMHKFKKKDKTFEESNIYTVCSEIISSIEQGNIDNLNTATQKYKIICKLDESMVIILDNILDREIQKKKLREKEVKVKDNNEEDNNINEESNLNNNINRNSEINNKENIIIEEMNKF